MELGDEHLEEQVPGYGEESEHWTDIGTAAEFNIEDRSTPLYEEYTAAMAKLDEPVRVEVSTALGDSWLYRMYRERFSSESSYALQITGKKSVPITTGELWLYKNRAAHRRALRLATQRRRIARRRGVPAKLVDVVTWVPRARVQVTPIANAIARAVSGVAPLQASFEAADTAAEQWNVAEGNEAVFLDECSLPGCPGGHGYSEEED